VTDNPIHWVDPWGLEKIVVSGNHSISILKQYAISNFIEPAIRTIREWLGNGQYNESITWLIANDGYGDSYGIFWNSLIEILSKLQNDFPSCFANNNATKSIAGLSLALKDGVHKLSITTINNKNDMKKYITDRIDRNAEKITEMIIFSHGLKGVLALGYNTKTSLNISALDVLSWGDISSSFSKDYFCILYACNMGTQKNGTSFAQVWADTSGGYVIGLAGTPYTEFPYDAKTDFSTINEDRDLKRFSPEWYAYWSDTPFFRDGSWYYPVMSKKHPGVWNVYTPYTLPVDANSIMNTEVRKTVLPTLKDIKSLFPKVVKQHIPPQSSLQ
jgi:hypothetical protein